MSIITSLTQFIAGTKALSSEINGNFETVRVAHNDLESKAFKKDGSVVATGDFTMGGKKISNMADPISSQDAATKNYVKTELALIQGVPAGTVIYYSKNSPPSGYLKANGAAISRATYADLFAAIGTTYGSGDNTTTFNLPDLRGQFIRSWSDDGTVDTGRAFGSNQTDQAGQIHLNIAVLGGNDDGGSQWAMSPYQPSGTGTTFNSGQETRPVNTALLACIKY